MALFFGVFQGFWPRKVEIRKLSSMFVAYIKGYLCACAKGLFGFEIQLSMGIAGGLSGQALARPMF